MEKTRILAICVGFVPSFELGVRYPLQHLEKRDLIETRFLLSCYVRSNDLCWCDVLVAVRSFDSVEAEMVKTCKHMGKYICYYMDDDLLNIPAGTHGNEVLRKQKTRQIVLSIMGYSDCLWTPNKYLANKYSYIFSKTAVIDAPAILLDYKHRPLRKARSQICIGFAGGFVHSDSINKLLAKPFKKLELEFGDSICFEFFGAKPVFASSLRNCKCIDHVSSYESYISIMLERDWDLAVAPLEFTEFTACKYFNKFLEYGSIGIPCVYSDVPPFNLVVKNDETGILSANDCYSWVEALKKLITSKELRNNISVNARNYLLAHNTLDAIELQIEFQIEEILDYKAKKIQIGSKEYKKIKYSIVGAYLHKCSIIIDEKGLMVGCLTIFKKVFRKILLSLA